MTCNVLGGGGLETSTASVAVHAAFDNDVGCGDDADDGVEEDEEEAGGSKCMRTVSHGWHRCASKMEPRRKRGKLRARWGRWRLKSHASPLNSVSTNVWVCVVESDLGEGWRMTRSTNHWGEARMHGFREDYGSVYEILIRVYNIFMRSFLFT